MYCVLVVCGGVIGCCGGVVLFCVLRDEQTVSLRRAGLAWCVYQAACWYVCVFIFGSRPCGFCWVLIC